MTAGLDTSLVIAAAFVAGCIDAIAGGGGLIQLPTLFGVYPASEPAVLLGTNKFASIFGTANAVRRYAGTISIPWRMLIPLMVLVLLTSAVGAMLATHVPPDTYRPLVPVLLVAILIVVLRNRYLGSEHQPRIFERSHLAMAVALMGGIGFYDGFFGPGTGSLFMFVFIRLYGYDFLNAAASARVLNVMTNAAAVLWFVVTGKMMWVIAIAMAISNVAGSALGTKLALHGGNGFVRKVFVALVLVLVVRTTWVAIH